MANPNPANPPPASAPRHDRYVINIALGNDNEPQKVFVGGCPEGDFYIERGKDVLVPRSVLTRLDDAVVGIPEPDPSDPDGRMRITERKRFPYTLVRTPSPAAGLVER